MFGNYAILKHEDTQDMHHEIANLLKSIMIEFTKPVCPYDVYEKYLFPNIDNIVKKDHEEKMKFLIDLAVNQIGAGTE